MPIETNADELAAALRDAPVAIRNESKTLVRDLAWDAQRDVMDRILGAPRVDLGELGSGIDVDFGPIPDGFQAVVHPSEAADRYAIFVEEDTRPHWPPPGALSGWADRHGIPEFLVARKIAQEGTEGIHMFAEAWDKLISRNLRQQVTNMGRRILNRITHFGGFA